MRRFSRFNMDGLMRLLWALALLLLPVTSFRYLPFLGAGTQVRPLSFIPSAFLFFLISIRYIREGRVPDWVERVLPILAFVFIALLVSAIGFFFSPLDLFNISYGDRVLRAWVTLAVGLVFLFTAIGMNKSEQDVRFTLKWLYWGFALQAGWSLLQLVGFYFPNEGISNRIIDLLDAVQNTLFVAGLAPHQRISGLTLEPSWLAAQLITLYLPWAFAGILKGWHLGHRAWLMPVILLVSLVLLVFTFSRSGIIAAGMAMFITFLAGGRTRVEQAWRWFIKPFRTLDVAFRKKIQASVFRVLIVVGILVGVIAAGVMLARNPYFSLIWQSNKTSLVDYVVDISAGPRLAYAWAGWTIFEQHPWSGVGLGAAGLYIRDAFPEWAHFNVSEVSILLSQGNTAFPNTKNLYIRLLSETGIFGFWLFISFYLSVLGRILHLFHSSNKSVGFIAAAGLGSWVAIVVLGFTQDSFAMPIIWLPFGIILGFHDGTA